MSNSHSSNPDDYKYSFSGADCTAAAFYPNQYKIRKYLLAKIAKFEAYIDKLKGDPTLKRMFDLINSRNALRDEQKKVHKDRQLLGEDSINISDEEVRALNKTATDASHPDFDAANTLAGKNHAATNAKIAAHNQAEADQSKHLNSLTWTEYNQNIMNDDQMNMAIDAQEEQNDKLGDREDKLENQMENLAEMMNENNIEERAGLMFDDFQRAVRTVDKLNALLNKFGTHDHAELESMATISISIHEPKGVVRRLGYKNICGLTRSVRTIAGSMIFTVVEDHPLAKLMALDPQQVTDIDNVKKGDIVFKNSLYGWHKDQNLGVGDEPYRDGRTFMRVATDLAPFNLILKYVSEYFPYDHRANSRIGAYAKSRVAKLRKEQANIVKEYHRTTGVEPSDWGSSDDRKLQYENEVDINQRFKNNFALDDTLGVNKQTKKQLSDYNKQMEGEFKAREREIQSILASYGKGKKVHNKPMGASLVLENVEFLDQGMVTSANDMVTEITFNFVASNIYDLSAYHGTNLGPFSEITEILEEWTYINGGDLASEERAAIQSQMESSLKKNPDDVKLGQNPVTSIESNPIDQPLDWEELGYDKDDVDEDWEKPDFWIGKDQADAWRKGK